MFAFLITALRRLAVDLALRILQCHGLMGDAAPRAEEWIVVHTPAISRWRQYAQLLMVREWCRNGYSAYGNYLQIFTRRARRLAVLNGEIEDMYPSPRVRTTSKPKGRPARPMRQ